MHDLAELDGNRRDTLQAGARIQPEQGSAINSRAGISASAPAEWQIGQLVLLQQGSIRYQVRLLGYAEGKSILVSAPMAEGRYQLIRDGQAFVARTFAGKKAYAFTTAVLKTVHAPYPYLHLAFPKQISCAVVRRRARVEVVLVAAVARSAAAQAAAIILADIGMGGVAGSIKERIGMPGESFRLKLKVTVFEENIFLDLPVILRSVQEEREKGSHRHAFEFGATELRDKLALAAFLYETLSERE